MTIFITWQSRVTVDSIRNSCNVLWQSQKIFNQKQKFVQFLDLEQGVLCAAGVHWDQWEETVNLEQRSNNSQGQVQKYKYTKTEMQKHKQKSHMCTYMCSCVIIVIWPVDASEFVPNWPCLKAFICQAKSRIFWRKHPRKNEITALLKL